MPKLREITLLDLLSETVVKYSHKEALICGDYHYNWSEVNNLSDKIAMGLMAVGVEKGSHVGVMSGDSHNCFLFVLGIIKCGAVAVMINPAVTSSELESMAKIAELTHLSICDSFSGKSQIEKIAKASLPIKANNIFCLNNSENDYLSIDEIIVLGEKTSSVDFKERVTSVLPSDDSFILFTSGTTGTPKAVSTTHYMRANNAIAQACDIELTHKDNICIAIPIFHCFSLSANYFAGVAMGSAINIPKDKSTANILEALSLGATILNAVPTLYSALIKSKSFDKDKVKSLRLGVIGGSAYTEKQFLEIEKSFEFMLIPSLGQTEATAGITTCRITDSQEIRAHTIGHFMDNLEGAILDINTGKKLTLYMEGEIAVKGYSVMNGYYNNPNTSNPIDEYDFLHTGDLGFIDENSNIHYTGRLKQLIIRGGENISPLEIERCLLDSNLPIDDVKVLGIEDYHYGEEIAACIIKKQGYEVTSQEIIQYLGEKLAYYKIPKYIEFFSEFPLGESGKINMQSLKLLLNQRLDDKK